MNFLAKSTKLVDSCFAPFNFPYNESYDGGGAKTKPKNALISYKKSCKYRKKLTNLQGYHMRVQLVVERHQIRKVEVNPYQDC